MGTTIKSKCANCNLENTFNYGGTKSDYKINCPVPAINRETGEFENVNYKTELNNPKYTFYSDKVLKGKNDGKHIFKNFNLTLNADDNYCPSCTKYSLAFRIRCYTD